MAVVMLVHHLENRTKQMSSWSSWVDTRTLGCTWNRKFSIKNWQINRTLVYMKICIEQISGHLTHTDPMQWQTWKGTLINSLTDNVDGNILTNVSLSEITWVLGSKTHTKASKSNKEQKIGPPSRLAENVSVWICECVWVYVCVCVQWSCPTTPDRL